MADMVSCVVWCLLLGVIEAGLVQRFDGFHVPRLTLDELLSNATLRTGRHTYILDGFVKENKWKSLNYTLDTYKKKVPFEWVDYYMDGLATSDKKPHLIKVEKAMDMFKEPSAVPRYMQLRLGLRGWKRLRKSMQPMPDPDLFWEDDPHWINKCMVTPDGKADEAAIDNFYATMQWKFLVIGEKGTKMFFHKDKSSSSSWYAQLKGSKKFTLCPNSESHLLSVGFDTFNEKNLRDPKFAQAKCAQVTVKAGDLLYYAGFTWHHTLNLETPSIAYLGALVGNERPHPTSDSQNNKFYQGILKDECAKCWDRGNPKRKCDDISLKWPGAAPPMMRATCEEYMPACFRLWEAHTKSMHSVKGEL